MDKTNCNEDIIILLLKKFLLLEASALHCRHLIYTRIDRFKTSGTYGNKNFFGVVLLVLFAVKVRNITDIARNLICV